MKYLVAFDVCNGKRRTAVGKACLAIGFRVQESVFEVFAEGEKIAKFKGEILKKINAEVDSVRIYPLDKFADSGLEILGQGKRIESANYVIV